MGGLSYTITDQIQIVGDSIAGSSNYSTLGVIANITPALQADLAYSDPNTKSAGPKGYLFNLTYIFHINTKSKKPTESSDSKGSATVSSGK